MISFMGAAGGKPTGPAYAKLLARVGTPLTGTTETAEIAAGCFWGVELAFSRIPGVTRTSVGYTQGHVKDPTYRQVCSGTTGHVEALQLDFDPNVVSYEELLDVFWERHNSTTLNRQGNDVGTQYRSGIYYHSEAQKEIAEKSKSAQIDAGVPVVTEILKATTFYDAEEYHQKYLEKGGQCAAKGDTTAIRCYG